MRLSERNDIDRISLENVLSERLSQHRSVLETVVPRASDIIVYGSFPSRLATVSSDIDVLIIGSRRMRVKTKLLDLVVLPQREVERHAWTHSEILRHIYAYGVSLKHVVPSISVVIDDYAADRKRERITAFVHSLGPVWANLEVPFRRKYLTKLRRETQRWSILLRGEAVPPTAVLDRAVNEENWLFKVFADFLDLVRHSSPKDNNTANRIVDDVSRLYGSRANQFSPASIQTRRQSR